MLEVAKLSLRYQRNALIGWAVALFLLAAMTAGFYHYIGPEYENLFESLPEGFADAFVGEGIDPSTPEGFLTAEFLSYIPLVYAIYAISQGARALAGEEEEGTLDILLAGPVSRIQVAMEKILATSMGILVLVFASAFGLLIGVLAGGVDVAWWRMFLVGLDLVPITLFFFALAFLGSAVFHRRGRASLIATSYAVAAYFINLFAPLASELDPIKWVSIFHYFQDSQALTGSLSPLYWGVCLFLSVGFLAGAVLWFDRKDLVS